MTSVYQVIGKIVSIETLYDIFNLFLTSKEFQEYDKQLMFFRPGKCIDKHIVQEIIQNYKQNNKCQDIRIQHFFQEHIQECMKFFEQQHIRGWHDKKTWNLQPMPNCMLNETDDTDITFQNQYFLSIKNELIDQIPTLYSFGNYQSKLDLEKNFLVKLFNEINVAVFDLEKEKEEQDENKIYILCFIK
jgi:hypothetical protein